MKFFEGMFCELTLDRQIKPDETFPAIVDYMELRRGLILRCVDVLWSTRNHGRGHYAKLAFQHEGEEIYFFIRLSSNLIGPKGFGPAKSALHILADVAP